MPNKKVLQIILNVTFIIMISCYDNKLYGSTHFLKPINKNHTINITSKEGNFTIRNSKIILKNESDAKEIMEELEKSDKEMHDLVQPFLNNIIKLLRSQDPITSLPTLGGKNATFVGNGTYRYTNLTDGHSFEINLNGITIPNGNKTLNSNNMNVTNNFMNATNKTNITHLKRNATQPMKKSSGFLKNNTIAG